MNFKSGFLAVLGFFIGLLVVGWPLPFFYLQNQTILKKADAQEVLEAFQIAATRLNKIDKQISEIKSKKTGV